MRLLLSAILIAAVMPAALSQGENLRPDYLYPDYLYPDMSQTYLKDWLEGGYVRSLDRSKLMDPGIAGMVRWLDAPVPSYPWYSSDVSFYKRLAPESTFTPYSQYYAQAEAPQEAEILSSPVSFNITLGAPKNVFYGTGQGLPFPQYLSTEPSRSSDLWIRGPENWTEYVVSPVGAMVELVANVPGGGSGGFYQTVQTESASLNSRTYQFYDGYNSMIFRADRIGRNLLYFVVNNQPSNVVVIDVFAQAPAAPPSQATVPAQGTQPTLATQPLQAAQQPSYPLPGSASTSQYPAAAQAPTGTASLGDTQLTIYYPGPSNFQVFVDGVDVGVGSGGSFSTRVKGGASHVISIWDGFWMYQNDVYFESGVPKVINVEAV
ncbi:MAG: hypothetical protein ACP5OU_09365 [Methanothrix sp.]